MKRLLKDWWKGFILAVRMCITAFIIPVSICFLSAIGASYIARFFTNNKNILWTIGIAIYVVVGLAICVFLGKRYDKELKNSQDDTRE